MYYTKEQLVEIMTDWLPVLRASVNMTQIDLCDAIGISRQTYSAIECRKKDMSWTVFLSLFLFFIVNSRSRTLVRKKENYVESVFYYLGAGLDDVQNSDKIV